MKKGMSWEEEKQLSTKHISASHKYNRRRRTKEGYPIEARKFTYDEIKAYQETPRVLCLLCGHDYGTLAKHLVYVHDVTVKEYKDMYGLPNKEGLSSKTTKRKKAAIALKRMEDDAAKGKKTVFNDPEMREEVRKTAVVASQHQQHQPFRTELSRNHIAKANTNVKDK